MAFETSRDQNRITVELIGVMLLEKLDPSFQLILHIAWNYPFRLKLHGKNKDIPIFLDHNETVASFALNVRLFLFCNAIDIQNDLLPWKAT